MLNKTWLFSFYDKKYLHTKILVKFDSTFENDEKTKNKNKLVLERLGNILLNEKKTKQIRIFYLKQFAFILLNEKNWWEVEMEPHFWQ